MEKSGRWAGALACALLAAHFILRFARSGYFLLAFKAAVCLGLMTIFLVRRSALRTDSSPFGIAAPLIHMAIPLGFTTGLATPVPAAVSVGLVLAGLLISSMSYIDLWEYFGILPAYRGVRSSGVYRLVRHPIYLGYLLAGLGWTLYSFCPTNAAILAAYAAITILRIRLEERILLASDPAYRAYCGQVRYRLLPWLI